MARLRVVSLCVLGIALCVGLLLCLPRQQDVAEAAAAAWRRFKTAQASSIGVPQVRVMSFNIRFDGQESDARHHWTQRMTRIAGVLAEYEPWSVGLQEPFSGQVLHLQSILPAKWRTVGYRQHSAFDLGHPSRHDDHQVGILYDATKLRLLRSAYQWLSETPDVEQSRSWGSAGARTINMAHFELVDQPGVELLHFNTHLDMISEHARREQAKVAMQFIRHHSQLYPNAATILTGDFNAAVGQHAYQTLTGPDALRDAWVECESHQHDRTNTSSGSQSPSGCQLGAPVASSFHGWQGLRTNLYGVRLLAGAAFTLHGMGFTMPPGIPSTLRQMAGALLGMLRTSWRFPIAEAIPQWPLSRLHVDWILYRQPRVERDHPVSDSAESAAAPLLSSSGFLQPRFVALVDIRADTLYASDHYPLLAVFQMGGGNRIGALALESVGLI
jgi:endonuclease/exonuclease/phosphatase family metal-dependent hydrolase